MAVALTRNGAAAPADGAPAVALATVARRYYAHDHIGRSHATKVTRLAVRLGVALELSRAELVPLALGALLHDVGKLAVPTSVLDKPCGLSDAEWQLVRKHPAAGEQIVAPLVRHPGVAAILRWHHERYDGRGYPDRLQGEEIPRVARIVAVADAYEAMVAARPYASPRSPRDALTEVASCAGRQFDAVCVDRLHEVIRAELEVAA
jgi:HD-GYP domain-containing protein (c-di-GMP phosphodiesterase class II)